MDYEKIEKNARLRDRVRKTITYFFLTVWGILVLFPFYWMVLTSVKSACFDGDYPTSIPEDTRKDQFEQKLSQRKAGEKP